MPEPPDIEALTGRIHELETLLNRKPAGTGRHDRVPVLDEAVVVETPDTDAAPGRGLQAEEIDALLRRLDARLEGELADLIQALKLVIDAHIREELQGRQDTSTDLPDSAD